MAWGEVSSDETKQKQLTKYSYIKKLAGKEKREEEDEGGDYRSDVTCMTVNHNSTLYDWSMVVKIK